jgi:hypothetical protein
MPNHLHLVIHQGDWPLERTMQPLLRRIAGLVHRRHGTEGHVFERRFHDRPCLDPVHARNTLAYVNLNPVRAGLVEQPGDYPWMSHRMYAFSRAGPRCMEGVLAVECGLRLFGTAGEMSLAERRRAYVEFLAWRMRRDDIDPADGEESADSLSPPAWVTQSVDWGRTFGPLFATAAPTTEPGDHPVGTRPDPHDLARPIARESRVELDAVRSSYRGRKVTRVRREIVIRLHGLGHPSGAIARYLRVTPQCVSNILSSHRRTVGPGH